MTVAVAVKVYDGIVLATDSAGTLGGTQVYNNSNKLFQLHRAYPVGAVTWGHGNIESASISTLMKDLRARLMGRDDRHLSWKLRSSFSVRGVLDRLVEHIFDELYAPAGVTELLGFMVAGFSGGSQLSEAWEVTMHGPTRPVPQQVWSPKDVGAWAAGQPEAFCRLVKGYEPSLATTLAPLIDPAQIPAAIAALAAVEAPFVQAAMPFADAVDLARFLVDVTIGYRRFQVGPDTVGGPIDIAGISRHEGFKWIARKHYYSPELNPGVPHQHDR